MFIIGYDCMTSAGNDFEKLMAALYSGFDNSSVVDRGGGKVCFLKGRSLTSTNYKDQFVLHLSELTQNIFSRLATDFIAELRSQRVGVIFCSTKGNVEDYIWQEAKYPAHEDPYDSILQNFIGQNLEINFSFSCTLSNACSSSHVGLEYAQQLFRNDRLDHVLIIAGDLIGPFVYKGFNSLKLLTHTSNAPFDQSRDGLQLGDGFAAMLLSKKNQKTDSFRIDGVASETEGGLITRPSFNGDGLLKALQKAISSHSEPRTPDFVVAHGTGTTFNDFTEDAALSRFFTTENKPIVTGTKWCVGHTLGASGLIDIISACEVIKRQKLFCLHRTLHVDRNLKMNYLLNANRNRYDNIYLQQALITSLGFGGVHAALTLSRHQGEFS